MKMAYLQTPEGEVGPAAVYSIDYVHEVAHVLYNVPINDVDNTNGVTGGQADWPLSQCRIVDEPDTPGPPPPTE